MLQNAKELLSIYNDELLKQKEPYRYYLNGNINKGEHENVPFICIDELTKLSEDDNQTVYEWGDYLLFESKKGSSSDEEKKKLLAFADKLNADLIYSDYDHVDKNGCNHTPFFKPDYSRDTFECFDMYSEFYAVKKNKSRMMTDVLENIVHICEPLFHWHCEDNAEDIAELHKLNNIGYRTDAFYLDNPETSGIKDSVSVVIPSKDNPELLDTLLSGIQRAIVKSGINTFETVVIDNGSSVINKGLITNVIKKYPELSVKYIYDPADFNFSYMCNKGASESRGEYLLFMNDDIEVTDDLFILKLLYFASKEHVGACGAKLLYPGAERLIQHIGITCLKDAGPTHKLSTFPDDKMYYFGRNKGIHNCLAVTGACLMVSREKYFKTGGFHDKMKVGYNDVDLCVSLYESGLLNVVNNDCVLVHHESVTRGSDAASEAKLSRLDAERKLLYERHPSLLKEGDPFYNRNLAEDFLEYRVNVVPDFERRDYVSREITDTFSEGFVSRLINSISPKSENGASRGLYYNIENVHVSRGFAEIKGWALVNKKAGYRFDTYVTVKASDGRQRIFETAPVLRCDLKEVFPDAEYTELSGFMARIPADVINHSAGESAENTENSAEKGTWSVGVILNDKQTGKKYYAGQ